MSALASQGVRPNNGGMSAGSASKSHRVVIVGGGFGGLHAARSLKRAPVRVTLIDRRNFHLFQPLLYQVATGALSPADITSPLRGILRRQSNAFVMLGEVSGFNVSKREVLVETQRVEYETLIVAAGLHNNYFGNEGWEKHAPGLKTIEDATDIRRRILGAFERAERESDPVLIRELLTFVVIGGGPTGVELAGAVAEVAKHTLRHDFRAIDPRSARIELIEGANRILPLYPEDLSVRAQRSLENLGIQVRTGWMVSDIQRAAVTIRRGEETETIATHTVLWAAGIRASPLGQALAEQTGAELDAAGRILVRPDLTLPGHPEIVVIGDLAHCQDKQGQPLPGIAPVAMQQGQYAAKLVKARLRNRAHPPFRYRYRGQMATIGRAAAVADLGRLRFGGYFAWLLWLFVHLLALVEFENRLLVFVQWTWNYITRNRSARLITGDMSTRSLPFVSGKRNE